MGVCSCSSKTVIIIINLFFLLGAALLIYAGVVYLDRADGVVENVDHTPAFVAFGVAGVLILCGLVGIAGALSEKKILLGMFAAVVLAALVLLLYVTLAMFVKHSDVVKETDTFVVKQYNNYGNPNLTGIGLFETVIVETTTSPSSGSGNATTTAPDTNGTTMTLTTSVQTTTATPAPDMNATNFIDNIQSNLKCCGFNNYTDWNTYDYWINHLHQKGFVPSSCCNATAVAAQNKTCQDYSRFNMENITLIYTDPCKKEIHTVVNFVYYFMNYTALTFTILVLLGFIASIYLMCRKRSSDGFNYSSIVA